MEIVLSHNYRNKDRNNVLHKESEACFPMYVSAKKIKILVVKVAIVFKHDLIYIRNVK